MEPEQRTPCEEYGHAFETEPEDILLHICRDCGNWYRD